MIIQGGNEPIVFQFDPSAPVGEMKDISIVLCKHSTTALSNKTEILKHWGKEDVTIDTARNRIIAPLTQTETMNYVPGKYGIEMKWLPNDSPYVRHLKLIDVEVTARCDEEVLS